MPTDSDLELSSGRLRARSWGAPDAPLLLCGHGLSANCLAFTRIAEALAGDDRRVVALDFRGRGCSQTTPPGSYGIRAHARDVLEAASSLGADAFDYAGWSMGALIGLFVVEAGAERLRSLSLIDHAGAMDAGPVELIRGGLARLDASVESPEQYTGMIRDAGAVGEWNDFWEAFYRYELGRRREDGSWTPVTSRAACTEDLDVLVDDATWTGLWARLTMPTVLIRALIPIGDGYIVPEHVRDDFLATAPESSLVELDVNHYTVMTHPGTADAIRSVLTR